MKGSAVKMAAGCFFICSDGALSAFTNPRRAIDGISGSLLSMEQGEALRMLRGVLLWEESLKRSLPPLLSDSVWEGKVWCIGGDREAARTRSGVEREFDSVRLWPPEDQLRPSRLIKH